MALDAKEGRPPALPRSGQSFLEEATLEAYPFSRHSLVEIKGRESSMGKTWRKKRILCQHMGKRGG